MNSCTIIILGATGDLAKRKLIPALYSLIANKKCEKFVFVGSAIDETTIDVVLDNAKEFIPSVDEKIWNEIAQSAYYQKLDFTIEKDFVNLDTYITELEKKHNLSGNRIVYLAALPSFFCEITEHCASSGLVKKTSRQDAFWHKIVYEKPFGWDLESAKAINACIKKYFHEDQIFRIDHYLTKEVVGNIALVRFANTVFEPIWNNHYIDQVSIFLEEKVCIEGRGTYYDKYGALRDVVQNHMLELLALVAMEAPKMLTGDYIRDQRVNVLKDTEFIDGILGQYDGYKKEEKVNPDSTTDTFASLLLKVNNKRWSGVPFYLKTGKCLGKKLTEIKITFKKIDCLLLKGCAVSSNCLTINIYPKGTFSLCLNAKKPGFLTEVTPVEMEFCHSCLFAELSPESYEVIFQEVMRGEQSISVRFDEIEQLWKITDKIIEKNLPVFPYKKESTGPKEAGDFEKKYGIILRPAGEAGVKK